MATRTQNIFVNLPVKDLGRSRAFFEALGYSFDERFGDDKAACLVLGDNIFAMLLTEAFFTTFTDKRIADTAETTEVLLCLSADSRAQVDQLVDAAYAAGGRPSGETQEQGPMYGRAFQDPDGHIWEVVWMDPKALPQG